VISFTVDGAFGRRIADRLGWGFAVFLAAKPSYRLWLERRTRLKNLKRLTDWFFLVRPAQVADVVFVPSRFTASEAMTLLGVPEGRLVIVSHGVEERFFRVPRAPYHGTVPTVLFYGSLDPIKGIYDAVRAAGQVAARGAKFQLRIAGWGEWDRLRQAVLAAGLSDRTDFLGVLDADALCAELARAAVALLPSHAESFGLAIAEAQAAGVPVVSYRAGAVPEVVEDRVTGLLCPLGDTDALAQALAQLLGDPVLRASMGEAARDRARRFTWEATATRMLEAMEGYRRT
jgi:glycosyltransferase involved in cell wall biosynthesis